MTAQEIIDATKDVCTYPGSSVDDKLLAYVNRAYHRIEAFRPWQWLEGWGNITTSSGVREYPLIGDGTYNVRPNSLKNVRDEDDGRRLSPMPKETITRWYPGMSKQTPLYYRASRIDTRHDNAVLLEIMPPPSGTYTIEFDYLKALTDLGSADTPAMPVGYHEHLLNMTIWLFAAGSEQNRELVATWKQMALEGLAIMQQNESPLDRIVRPNQQDAGRSMEQDHTPANYGTILDE